MLKFYVVKRTEVVNIRYAACDVYIGRAGRGEDGYFRNPFRLLPGMSRGATLDRYRSYFTDACVPILSFVSVSML